MPLNYLTEAEVDELHLDSRISAGTLLLDGGATVFPLYTASLPEIEATAEDDELHQRALLLGLPPHRALWAVNKLVKMVRNVDRRQVYSLKDRLLSHWDEYIIDARIAREESKLCWTCD